ncbi:PREDICTED: nuclear transcription factor Y subunit C-3 [Camelina sativa]|uniref:Nuclear transcription factor Y subunit C-3 n=1 Tax=Camelina sativa TaxID=90675 RepID=A0ABM0SR47_CAMSA|nr:PREDICTED: nuclear transcription factor Y subunit C-3 [Camelina sativa]
MDQQGQSSAMNYGSNPYQTNPMTTAAPAGSDHPAYHQIHQQQQQQLTQQLQSFWETQFKEIEKTTDFKNHSLPLARIKKIMKADEDVRMISAEAPVVFARACEMFILELTLRSWNHTEENKRRTLQKNDIAAAVTRTDIFDFLVDIVPREDLRDEVLGGVGAEAATASGYPYGYLPPGTAPIGNPGMVMGNPGAYPPNAYMGQPMWQQQAPEQQDPDN